VEKPPTQKISEIEYIIKRFPDAKIGVDYIEMAHPVVRAIKDRMVKEGFLPVYFWNHRSKDLRGNKRGLGGEGSRVVLEDLVHDLSEIDFFLRFVEKKSLNDVFRSIENAYILKWNELEDKKFQYSTDVRAKFSLNFKDGRQAHIEGGFADPEIRQFYIYAKEGEKSEILFYGNTLTREKISPVAAMISGSVNIRKFEEEVKTFRSQMTKFNSRH
jgi:hypothetical protein